MQYRPDWAFHQLGLKLALGAPLGKADPVAMDASQYNFQVYATDTLYNLIPNWSDVKRLSELVATGPRRAVLSAEATNRRNAVLSADVKYDPELKEHYVVRYRVPGMGPSAYTSRGKAKISVIIVHATSGPTEAALERMTAPGAKSMSHYYIADDARIYRLLSDRQAAKHAGMATWNGSRCNMNRISLGISVERSRRGFSPKQLAALHDLIRTLRATYDIPANAVMRWADLVPGKGGNVEGLVVKA
jgi:hypothetical protein